MEFLGKRILVVTGKGGVGKSTVAAALAVKAAREGRRVLLVELGDRSFFEDYLETPGIHSTPTTIEGLGVQAALWDTESCLREWVLHYVKLEGIVRLFFENRVMRTFVSVAPTLKELAILGKLTSGMRRVGPPFEFDLVILDGYATGHMLALLRAPKGISELIHSGPMGHHSASIHKTLSDSTVTGYVVVTLPDELPVVETIELVGTLRSEFGVEPDVFVNKRLPLPLALEKLKSLQPELQSEEGLTPFVKYITSTEERQLKQIENLRDQRHHLHEIPMILETRRGQEIVRAISEVLK